MATENESERCDCRQHEILTSRTLAKVLHGNHFFIPSVLHHAGSPKNNRDSEARTLYTQYGRVIIN